MIYVNNLSFKYPDGTRVLQDIDFDLEEGACLALLGANGAGKTSLLYLLSGVIPHIIYGDISGQIIISSKDISTSAFSDVISEIGFVQQDPEVQILFENLVAELAFGPSNFGIPKNEIKERLVWALDAVGLSGFEFKNTSQLSYGQKQRLAIATALTTKPKILLLDEPLAYVDPSARRSVEAALEKIKKEGVTLIIATHDLTQISNIVDSALVLSPSGHQLSFGPIRKLISQFDLFDNARVRVPEITRFAADIGVPILPLSVLECYDVLKDIYDERINQKLNEYIQQIVPHVTNLRVQSSIINIEKLFYSYDGYLALNNINIQIGVGEPVAIIGENGSGKTTLIKNLVGLLRPQSGQIFLQGKDLSDYTILGISQRMGLVMQNPDHSLLYETNIHEEVSYGLRISKENTPILIDKKSSEVLQLVGLDKKAKIYPGKLSFGERKKLAFASILILQPKILILDEPLFGLDNSYKLDLLNILSTLQSKGHTIIVASHDIDTLTRFASRVIFLTRGAISEDGTPSEVFLSQKCKGEFHFLPPLMELAALLDNEIHP